MSHHTRCKPCMVITALVERAKSCQSIADVAAVEGQHGIAKEYEELSKANHAVALESALIHAEQLTSGCKATDHATTLPDGSTLGDWVAMARSVHGMDEAND